jgi:uncharacterized protein (TIGR03118 family)
MKRFLRCLVSINLLFGSLSLFADTEYVQDNLVSNQTGVAANTDPNLVNPWGMSFSPTSPFWISDQGTNLATLYSGSGSKVALNVAIPATGMPSGPTGQVFNSGTGFLVNGTPAHFLFDTLDGQILGWNAGTTAVTEATTPGAVYTGLAFGTVGSASYLYAADNAGQVRVFDQSFNDVTNTTFAGKFVDPNSVAGFTPFNVQNINGNIYVTYAAITAMGTGLPGGYVDEFDANGNFIQRIATGGGLYAPWGITLAPSSFGSLGGDLLIGQFGDGQILAYNSTTDQYIGTLNGTNNQPIVNPDLWAIDFRTGGPNVNTNALYFTAGIDNQMGGLFGAITPSPEPGTMTLILMGLGSLGVGLRKRRHADRARTDS